MLWAAVRIPGLPTPSGVAHCAAGSRYRLSELFDRPDRAMYVEKAAKRRSGFQTQAVDRSG